MAAQIPGRLMVGAAGVFAGAAATGNERWLGDFVSAARGALVRLPAEAPRASAKLAQIEVLGATVKTRPVSTRGVPAPALALALLVLTPER